MLCKTAALKTRKKMPGALASMRPVARATIIRQESRAICLASLTRRGAITQALHRAVPPVDGDELARRPRISLPAIIDSGLPQAIQKTAQHIDIGDDSDQLRVAVDDREGTEFIFDERLHGLRQCIVRRQRDGVSGHRVADENFEPI